MNITPYPKNAKKHPKKQIEQVAASIKEFGMNQPIVVDKDGVIIVGHGRYEALKHLGWEIKDEYIKVVDLTEQQAKAYRLADNKLNESDWEMDLVIEELKELDELVPLTGFDFEPETFDSFSLPDGDKPEYQQITFTLHDTQAELIKEALKAVQQIGVEPDSDNENSNGNAIYTICKKWFQQKT